MRFSRNHTARRNRGFTLVEIVVVLSVIGVLLALILPAVQQARQAARSAECKNNLRQMMLAVTQYHDVHRHVPLSVMTYTGNYPYPPNMNGYPWSTSLLPHMEQANIYDRLWAKGTPNVRLLYWKLYGRHLPAIDTVIPVFRCPESPLPDQVIHFGTNPLREVYEDVATMDYAACFNGAVDVIGLICDRWHRFADVTDGLSNTIVLGEMATPSTIGNTWNAWGTAEPGTVTFSAIQPPLTGGNPLASSLLRDKAWGHAYSGHNGFCNFAYGDGSVSPITESVDRMVFAALGGINDGRIVPRP